jgi:hypothetical protein
MNTGLKNKLLIMAAAAGLAGFGIGCSSSEEAPAAEEGAVDPTTGGEDMTAPPPEGDMGGTETPAPEGETAPAGEAAGGEGSCGEGSCS